MKKAIFNTLCALLMSCISLVSFAQQKTVTGTVTDEQGSPVVGATVAVKGGVQATATNEDGNFSIGVPTNASTLQITSVGFIQQDVSIIDRSNINVRLIADQSRSEDEVIVTALGIKRSPRSINYAAQKVDGKDLTIAQAPTIAQGLMGKVAGLNISQASGGVEGGSSRIVVRGNTTITGDNRALIIVDGVPINNDPLNANENNKAGGKLGTQLGAEVQSYQDWGTGLNFINPDDIENITVLKGPNAAALYGNRGANGVILVTRKKGEKRKGYGIDYSFSDRFTSVYDNFYNFQNEYGIGMDASLWTANNDKKFPINANGQRYLPQTYGPDNPGNYTGGAGGYLPYVNATGDFRSYNIFSYPGGFSWGPKFDNQPYLAYDGVMRPYSAKPNNWKAFYPNGYVSQHAVSVSGGGDFGSFRASYTRQDNKANVLNSNYSNNVFSIGSSIKISSKLTADITGSYVIYKRLNVPTPGQTYLMALMYGMTRDYDPEVDRLNNIRDDGSQRNVTNTSNFPAGSPPYPYNGGYTDNIYWNIYKNNTELRRNELTAGIKLTATPTTWLTLTAQGGLDDANDLTTTTKYPTDIQGLAGGLYQEAMTRNRSSNLNANARFYKDNIGDNDLNASFTVGGESMSINNYTTTGSTDGNFINPFLFYLGNGANPVKATDTRYAYKINSVFGILDLSYRNTLFFQLTGRNDWNSTLRSEYNSFFYPAANLGYVFSDGIKGLKSSPWLSFGKLSVGYAQTGSGTDPYVTNTLLDGSAYNGVVAQSYQNIFSDPRIKPARTEQLDIILNLGFFNNRLNLEVTRYSGTSSPQIVTNPLPLSSGMSSIRINDAKIGNKGIEFILNATPVLNNNFSWSIGINGAHATNKLISLSGKDSVLTLGSYYGSNGISQRVRVGDNYGTLYGRDYTYDANGQKIVKYALGSDGKPLYYNVNGQNYYAGTQWVLTDGEVPIGNSQPKLTGGISNTFKYKNFSLYFLTDFKLGGDTWFGTYGSAMGFGLREETVKERNGGGLEILYPDGSTGHDGMIMQGVFSDGTKNETVVPAPWYYGVTYSVWNNVGVPRSATVFENSWMKLREVNLSYQIPQQIVSKTKIFQNLNLSLIGRDLFYIFTTIPKGLNPEGVSGIGNMQGIEGSSMPNIRSIGFSIRASF